MVGTLRGYDQFMNIVLDNAVEIVRRGARRSGAKRQHSVEEW